MAFGIDLVTNGDFTAFSLGSTLIVDGDMEADDVVWEETSSATQEQTTDEIHSGSFSRKYVVSAAFAGMFQTGIDIQSGETYEWDFWHRQDHTNGGIFVSWHDGVGSDVVTGANLENTADTWHREILYGVNPTATARTNSTINFRESVQTHGGTNFVDDVTCKRVTLDNWTEGLGWRADVVSRALTNKAEHETNNATDLEQTGLTAEAGINYQITFTVTGRTTGAVTVEFGSTNGTARSTNATFVEEIVAGDTDHLKLKADATFNGIVETVIVQAEIVLGTGLLPLTLIEAAFILSTRFVTEIFPINLIASAADIVITGSLVKVGSEGFALQLSEAQTADVSFDSLGDIFPIQFIEVTVLSNIFSATSDSFSISLLEANKLTKRLTVIESFPIGMVSDQVILKSINVTNILPIGMSQDVALQLMLTVSEGLPLGMSELPRMTIAFGVSELLPLGMITAANIIGLVFGTDSVPINLFEVGEQIFFGGNIFPLLL